MSRLTLVFALLLAVVSTAPAAAAPGDLDPSFGTYGRVLSPVEPQSFASDALVQPDGSVVVAGGMEDLSGNGVPAIFRYLPDGRVDPSFGSNGVASLPPSVARRFSSVVLQPNGAIVAATAYSSSGTPEIILARFDSTGNLDPAFGSGGIARTGVLVNVFLGFGVDLALAPGGDLVAAATGPETGLLVARFQNDGQSDPTFSGDGVTTLKLGSYSSLSAVAVTPDGAATAVGSGSFPSDSNHGLVRFQPDGELDPAFGSGGIAGLPLSTGGLNDLALRSDGAGVTVGYDGSNGYRPIVLGFSENGTVDTSFGDSGSALPADLFGGFSAVTLQPDGGVVASGSVGNDAAVARFLSNGAADTSFSRDGVSTTRFSGSTSVATAVALAPDGRIVIAGEGARHFFRDAFYGRAVARFVVAPGPPDADADGWIDPRDRCPNVPADRHKGCPLIERSLRFRVRDNELSGKVRAPGEYACRTAARVTILKAVPGRDLRVARFKTEFGRFTLDARRFDGRFYARIRHVLIESAGICDAARSRFVVIPRRAT